MYFNQSINRLRQVNPDGVATVFAQRRHTWQEFSHRIQRLAKGLQELGVAPGDHIAMLSANSDRYIEYYFAVAWLGAVVVPLNFRWSIAELIYAADDAQVKVLVFDESFIDTATDLSLQLSSIQLKIMASDKGITETSCLDYETLIDNSNTVDPVMRDPEEIFGIFYTGGTTGEPKGVMLSTRSLWANVMFLLKEFGLDQFSKFLHIAPSFHLGDGIWCLGVTVAGGTHVVLPAFDAKAVIHAIDEHRITCLLLVPTMFKLLLDEPDIKHADLSSLETIVYGTSPIPDSVLQAGIKRMPHVDFIQAFGQTELSPIATILPARCHVLDGPLADKRRSVGQAIYGTEIKIIDPAGNPLPAGAVGEITVRGPGVMTGYWNKPEQTAATMIDGWVRMGDAGYLDEDAYLYVVDRIKDMVISGGENVYSVEVENAILKHEAVSACAVIGVPDEKWGERVHAVVVLRTGGELSQEKLVAHCRELIAAYKCPRSVEFVDALPLSAVGKVLKQTLRAPYWKDKTRGVN